MAGKLPFRQIHLDFHTHESIDGIAADFDPDAFGDTLQRAHVNSVNLFARCHHGWIYYDTDAFPERRHPHLSRNLLAEQIRACHERGIRAPIYISVQLDAYSATRHPEWCVRDERGASNWGYYQPGFYTHLCVNTGYREFLRSFVLDLFDCVPVDGFWFDIVSPLECNCHECRCEMLADGMDPSEKHDREVFARRTIDRFKEEMSSLVRSKDPSASIFYNSGHVGPSLRPSVAAYSHLEIESLPFAWGYSHFPLAVRYTRTLSPRYLGMTGKFHTSWGDFHSFKNRVALEAECFTMLAHGAKCSVGDQLHPNGELCEHTYQLIGDVYREVAAREPWCAGAEVLRDVAVLTPEEAAGTASHKDVTMDILGASRMLEELGVQFDVIDSHAELSRYRLLILPDRVPVDEDLAISIAHFVADGGKVLATHRSGLNASGDRFAVDLGVTYSGPDPWVVAYMRPAPHVDLQIRDTEHVCYAPEHLKREAMIRPESEPVDPATSTGTLVHALPDSTVTAEMVAPYFNRTWRHYTSHQHAPSTGTVYAPGVVMNDSTAYLSRPLFEVYGEYGPKWCRDLMESVIRTLLPEPIVIVTGAPKSLLVTVTRQESEGRVMVHLLNYIPRRNNERCDIIEDVVELRDVSISLRADWNLSRARRVPEDEALAIHRTEGPNVRYECTVPRLGGYQIIEFA